MGSRTMDTKMDTNKRKILVASLQGIGNTALLLPVLRELARSEECELDLVVSNNGSAQLLENNPDVGTVYIWDERKGKIANLRDLCRQIRQKRYDIAVAAFPNWTRENAVTLCSASASKRGYRGDPMYFIDRALCRAAGATLPRPTGQHDVLSNLNLFQLRSDPSGFSGRLLHYTREEITANLDYELELLRQRENKILIGLHPGTKATEKRWPAARYAGLAARIASDFPDAEFLIFGGPEEHAEMAEVHNGVRGRAHLLDSVSLRRAAWLISKCHLFIGNDSAPVHLAALQGIPTIAITGPADYLRTSPVGSKSIVIRKDYDCSPCYSKVKSVRAECRHSLRCIQNISLEEVYAVVSRCLAMLRVDKQGFDNRNMKISDEDAKVARLYSGTLAINLNLHGERKR